MNSSLQHSPHGSALILGGGGSTGNAWLIGVVAGLYEAGVDVTTADLIVGTSAGSTAAAQITSVSPPQLLDDILTAVPPTRPGPPPGDRGTAPATPPVNHLERTNEVIAASTDHADMRRRLAASALALDPDATGSARWRATVATRFPSAEWPRQRVLITAIDANTGDPVVFDRDSGIDLVDAVAASTSGGLSYGVGDQRYLDGGYRTNADNADLAAGYARVLVLSPFSGRTRFPEAWGMHLADQVAALRLGGSRVETVFPDPEVDHLFGTNALDLSLRPAAARAGHEQGRRLAERLGGFWSASDPT